MEECALSMEQRSNDAAVKDAQIQLRKEECARGMGQRSIDAVSMGAQIKLRKVECARNMGQGLKSNDAAVKDAPI
jgi:hypothetical protein